MRRKIPVVHPPQDLLPTEDQFRMRELVDRLSREEMPLDRADLLRLQHFVKVVRHEVVETPSQPAEHADLPGRGRVEVKPAVGGRAERVNYYMLNERGLKLKFQWERGLLDKLLD